MKIKDWLESIEERFERGINRDESVVFYPSYGFRDVDGVWKLVVRGIIYEERELLKHIPQLALTLAGVGSAGNLAKLLGESADDIDTVQYFKDRSKAFLVDGERNEQFEINLAGQIEKIGKSDSLGYFEILERFPGRKFILVGDSTEKDAEIYADLYLGQNFPDGFESKAYSDRIVKIYIRDVPNSARKAEAEAALNRITPQQGTGIAMLFQNPEDILEDASSLM